MISEKQKYLDWHKRETKKGLCNVKFLVNPKAKNINEEEFYKEANLINELHASGKSVLRPDVF